AVHSSARPFCNGKRRCPGNFVFGKRKQDPSGSPPNSNTIPFVQQSIRLGYWSPETPKNPPIADKPRKYPLIDPIKWNHWFGKRLLFWPGPEDLTVLPVAIGYCPRLFAPDDVSQLESGRPKG